jgi:N-methylhydantoinase B
MGEDVLYWRWDGGGGYGDPLERDPEAVVADIRNGVVSERAARETYGVVLGRGGLDREKTAALRADMRRRRVARRAKPVKARKANGKKTRARNGRYGRAAAE